MTSELAKRTAKDEGEYLKKQIGFAKTILLNLAEAECDKTTMLHEIYTQFDKLNEGIDVVIDAIKLIPKWDE